MEYCEILLFWGRESSSIFHLSNLVLPHLESCLELGVLGEGEPTLLYLPFWVGFGYIIKVGRFGKVTANFRERHCLFCIICLFLFLEGISGSLD